MLCFFVNHLKYKVFNLSGCTCITNISIEELTFALKTVPEPPYKYSSEKAEPVPGHRVLLNTLAAVIGHSHEISH